MPQENKAMEVWIGRNGERHGPYQEEQIRQWLRSGQLSPDDFGWYEGLADWQPLSVLFVDEVRRTPPASAPPAPVAAPAFKRAGVSYAGFWKRVVAYLIDSMVMYIPCTLLELPFGVRAAQEKLQQQTASLNPGDPAALHALSEFYVSIWPYFLIATLAWWIYSALCESSRWQATVGKLAIGIRVTDLNGGRISFPRAAGRYAGKFLSAMILLMGFLMVAFTERKQGLHDMMANTLVLNGRASDVQRPPAGTAQEERKSSFDA